MQSDCIIWIETARDDERELGPYRLCTDGGQRFALSANEARRAMLEQNVPFRHDVREVKP